MVWKPFIPVSLFLALASSSIYTAAYPSSGTLLDSSFYQDKDYFSRFDNQDFVFKANVDNDTIGIRDYLFHNSFNLLWRKNDGSSQENANAFLINIVYPDHLTETHPDRRTYVPKNTSGSDEVVLLVGTSFTFAKKLFKNINDWSKDVNKQQQQQQQQQQQSPKSLSDQSDQSDHAFYFSHPWPYIDQELEIPKVVQKHLYRYENEHYTSAAFDSGLDKAHYFKVDNKDVSVVYAAVDLEVNKDLVDFSLRSKWDSEEKINSVYSSKNKQYTNSIKDIYGNNYNLFVDFAVLQLKLKTSNIKKSFFNYLKRLYEKNLYLPQLFKQKLEVLDGRVTDVYMGGWDWLREKEAEEHTMDNLFIRAETKPSSSPSSKKPSEINDSNYSTYLDFDLYESYSEFSSKTKTTNYEIVDKGFYGNDSDGVLYCKFRIKIKNKQYVSSWKKVAFTGFKASSPDSKLLRSIGTWNDRKKLSDEKLIEFLEAKPKVTSIWKEFALKYSYFPFKNIRAQSFDNSSFSSGVLSNSIMDLSGKKYLNIAHHLDIPNLEMNDFQGSVAVTKHPSKNEKVILGMYDGTSRWMNPLRNSKAIGKVMLFISPWRYDLISKNNDLSKPSLTDVLEKWDILKNVVQPNRFLSRS